MGVFVVLAVLDVVDVVVVEDVVVAIVDTMMATITATTVPALLLFKHFRKNFMKRKCPCKSAGHFFTVYRIGQKIVPKLII
nr:hypothetical protein [Neobacillus mesonae]